eukprot:3540278-Pleurochrysis_carterae.AAC.1
MMICSSACVSRSKQVDVCTVRHVTTFSTKQHTVYTHLQFYADMIAASVNSIYLQCVMLLKTAFADPTNSMVCAHARETFDPWLCSPLPSTSSREFSKCCQPFERFDCLAITLACRHRAPSKGCIACGSACSCTRTCA